MDWPAIKGEGLTPPMGTDHLCACSFSECLLLQKQELVITNRCWKGINSLMKRRCFECFHDFTSRDPL